MASFKGLAFASSPDLSHTLLRFLSFLYLETRDFVIEQDHRRVGEECAGNLGLGTVVALTFHGIGSLCYLHFPIPFVNVHREQAH